MISVYVNLHSSEKHLASIDHRQKDKITNTTVGRNERTATYNILHIALAFVELTINLT